MKTLKENIEEIKDLANKALDSLDKPSKEIPELTPAYITTCLNAMIDPLKAASQQSREALEPHLQRLRKEAEEERKNKRKIK